VEGDAVHVLLLREVGERAGEARERDELLCAGLLGGHWKGWGGLSGLSSGWDSVGW